MRVGAGARSGRRLRAERQADDRHHQRRRHQRSAEPPGWARGGPRDDLGSRDDRRRLERVTGQLELLLPGRRVQAEAGRLGRVGGTPVERLAPSFEEQARGVGSVDRGGERVVRPAQGVAWIEAAAVARRVRGEPLLVEGVLVHPAHPRSAPPVAARAPAPVVGAPRRMDV